MNEETGEKQRGEGMGVKAVRDAARDREHTWHTHMRFKFQRDLRSSTAVHWASAYGAGYKVGLRPRTGAAPAASSFPLAQPVGDAWLR